LALLLLLAGLSAWLRWVPEPRVEPHEILERTRDRAHATPAESTNPATATPRTTAAGPDTNHVGTAERAASPAAPRAGRWTPADDPPLPGRPIEDLFEAQLALAREGLSPGSLDGVMGSRTRNALLAFQEREGLRPSGELDAATRHRLRLHEAPFEYYTVTAEDLVRLMPLGATWLAKSQQPRLDYETVLELVAERHWSHPDYVRRLNPTLDWDRITAGTRVLVPNVNRPPAREKAAFVRIRLASRILQVFDRGTRLIAHYPCSVARSVERQPAGTLRVEVLVSNPNYTYDPDRFEPSAGTADGHGRLILPPGPNNPVGTVWIGLDRPGYGIHGTPLPEPVGRPESMGCFRLANWNAEHLLELSWVGMPVYVEPD
jgi:lipoprotein-anchoring transpeptidase ErfK/SrfK